MQLKDRSGSWIGIEPRNEILLPTTGWEDECALGRFENIACSLRPDCVGARCKITNAIQSPCTACCLSHTDQVYGYIWHTIAGLVDNSAADAQGGIVKHGWQEKEIF